MHDYGDEGGKKEMSEKERDMLSEDEQKKLKKMQKYIYKANQYYHKNKANQYYLKKNYKKVIKKYSEGIDYCKLVLKKASPELRKKVKEKLCYMYIYQGICYNTLKKVKEAIADFSESIKINDTFYDAYFNRGTSYFNQAKYDKAIKDFSEVIENESNNLYAYIIRGLSYDKLKKHPKAIADFSKVLNNNLSYDLFTEVCYFRGNSYVAQKKYDEAFKDYSDAINNGILVKRHSKRLFYINIFIELIKEYKKYKDYLYKIVGLMIKVEEEIDKLLYKKSFETQYNNDKKKCKQYSHYSKPSILNNLIKGTKTKLRLYLIDHMNDPEEGKFIIYKNKGMKFFHDNNIVEDTHYCFVSCFVAEEIEDKAKAAEAENSLNLWRNYAKGDNGAEAAGVKIVLQEEFFSSAVNFLIRSTEIKNNNTNKNFVDRAFQILTGFYKIQYGKNRNEDNEDNKKIIDKIFKLFNKLKKEVEKIDSNNKNNKLSEINKNDIKNKIKLSVRRLTIEFKYLFKSVFYKSEKEFRLLAIIPKTNNKEFDIKIDKTSYKQYIEIDLDLFSQPKTKILLGKTMKNTEILKNSLEYSLKEQNKNNCTVIKSKMPFREI